MRRTWPVLFSGVMGFTCLIGVSGAAVAAPEDPPTAAAAQPAPIPENAAEIAELASGQLVLEAVPAAEALAAPALAPEMVEIMAAITAERTQVDDLTARLRATTDNAAALALEREIETTKRSTELTILGIQARHARAAGREEQALAIEASITQMTTVSPLRRPVDGAR